MTFTFTINMIDIHLVQIDSSMLENHISENNHLAEIFLKWLHY